MGSALRLQVSSAGERTRHLLIAVALAGWLAYTWLYPVLSTAHATLPPCPFFALTGHPCPLCGGTRSFAATWRGDFMHALHFYPLGPGLFAATVVGVPVMLWLAAGNRTVAWPPRLERAVWVAGGLVLSASWVSKLVYLGN